MLAPSLELSACCLALLQTLGSNFVNLPGDFNYEQSVDMYYSQQESSLRPDCVVKPFVAEEVATTIRVISEKAGTLPEADINPQCQLAIRGGGYGTARGAANIEGGVLLDLEFLDFVVLPSGGSKKIALGPGATWGEVYGALAVPPGSSVVGARHGGVGVGGLITSGGLSFFSGRKGWTFDSVLLYEVALADGRLINATETENQSLFRALRGGSNNLGIVTRVELETFQQGRFWGGISSYDISTANRHLEALADLSAAPSYDEDLSLTTTFALIAGSPPLITTCLHYTKAVANPPTVQPITSIPSLSNTLRFSTANVFTLELSEMQPLNLSLRRLNAEITFEPSLPMLKAAFQLWKASQATVKNTAGISWNLTMEPLPPAIYARAPPESNSLGLEGRNGTPLMVTVLSVAWASNADDAKVTLAARALMDGLAIAAKTLGVDDRFVLLGYAATWQDPISSYGSAAVERLKRVQQQYDPTGFFTRLVPGGFKIPNP